MWVLGTKGLVRLTREDLSLEDKYVSFLDKFDYSKVANLKDEIIKEYLGILLLPIYSKEGEAYAQ